MTGDRRGDTLRKVRTGDEASMLTVRVAGSEFSLSAHEVERHLAEADPEPISSHYAW